MAPDVPVAGSLVLVCQLASVFYIPLRLDEHFNSLLVNIWKERVAKEYKILPPHADQPLHLLRRELPQQGPGGQQAPGIAARV